MILFVLIVVVSASGCAYFNTYTNAKRAFKDAEEMTADSEGNLSPTARKSYDLCITKCQKLMDEFPESRWVDDALFLMSKAYFRKREYGRCLTRLDELDERFPENEFREESIYMRGICHLEREEESRAIAELAKLEEQFPESKFLAESMYRSAEAEYRLGNWPLALKAYGHLIERFEKGEWSDEARLKRGRIHIELKDHASAVEEFERLNEVAGERDLAFEGQLLRVESLLELRRYEEAHDLLDDLEAVAAYFQRRPEALLLRAKTFEKEGRMDETLQLLEDIANDSMGTPLGSEAWYRIGLIRQIHRDDPEGALEAFEMGAGGSARTVYRDLSKGRKSALQNYLRARDTASSAESDSSQAEAHYRLAENQFLQLEDPDAALEGYRKVLDEFPESPWAPRAAYALCYIHRYSLADTLAALDAAERLLANYPESRAADWVRGWPSQLGSAP